MAALEHSGAALGRLLRAERERSRLLTDRGNAIVEFVFVAVVVMLPLLYLIVCVAAVEQSNLAVTQAAREAGRAFATSDSSAQASTRLALAVHLALADRGVRDDAAVRFVAARSSCDGPAVSPRLAPGAAFAICVSRHVDLPALPRYLQGRGITTVGRYVVHVDEYRTFG